MSYTEGTYNLDTKTWFKIWNHWANPLGNWHEPMPYPLKRRLEAPNNEILAWLWWTLRNPFHNLTHFVLGHVPVGERYQWLPPKRDWPQWKLVFGWTSRGSFSGLKLRREE